MKNNILLLALVASTTFFAQDIYRKDGYAADGFDVVAYFDNQAHEGDPMFTATHDGVKYKFKNKKNRELFIGHPKKYLPQYGGYCAYAIAKDAKRVKINPESFLIKDGKLYLFYDFIFADTLEKWNEEGSDILQPKADKNWEKMQMKKKH